MGGLRRLLYGKYRPEILLRRFGEEQGRICQIILSEPPTPAEYMSLHRSLRERWMELEGSEFTRQWPADYFFFPDDCPEPVHILSSFYRKFIRYELRMTFLALLKKQEDSSVPVEVLRYDLVTVLESWVDMLQDCKERLRTGESSVVREEVEYSDEDRTESLQRYLWQRLFLNLETSIFELQVRFPLIPENRRITRHHLYLKKIGGPMPGQPPYVRTSDQTKRELQLLIFKKNGLKRIDTLIRDLQREILNKAEGELRTVLGDSLNLLQNARLCIIMRSAQDEKQGKRIAAGILDTEQSRYYLFDFMEKLRKGVELSPAEKESMDYLIHALADCRELFAMNPSGLGREKESEAVQLLRLIDNNFGSSNLPEFSQTKGRKENEPSPDVGLLEEYLDMDEIIRKLNVTSKTMKKYLDESGVEVIEFSSQRQLIHQDEVRKLLNYYAKLKK